MSIKCMNWAWDIYLSPTAKLVLMSLADNANDFGECFPSVKYIAQRCCISRRTVQRVLRGLEQKELINTEVQNRKDGSNTSNMYRLNIRNNRDDKFTPLFTIERLSTEPAAGLGSGCQKGTLQAPPDGDSRDTPLTTIEPKQETTTTEKSLVWPIKLNAAHRNSITNLSNDISSKEFQLLLDELAGQIDTIKSPVGYFRSLLESYSAGTFIPAKALNIQSSREAQSQIKHRLVTSQQEGQEQLQKLLEQRHSKKHGGSSCDN